MTTTNTSTFQTLLEESLQNQNKISRELGLFIPDGEQAQLEWNSFFRLIRMMYAEELIEKEDVINYLNSFRKIADHHKSAYIKRLLRIVNRKIEENNQLEKMFEYDRLLEKFNKVLFFVPEERRAEFITKLFGDKVPQEVLDEFEIKSDDDLNFSEEELVLLTEGMFINRYQDIRKKPLNASQFSGVAPQYRQFNQPVSKETLAEFIDQSSKTNPQPVNNSTIPVETNQTPRTQSTNRPINPNIPPQNNPRPRINPQQFQTPQTNQNINPNQNRPALGMRSPNFINQATNSQTPRPNQSIPNQPPQTNQRIFADQQKSLKTRQPIPRRNSPSSTLAPRVKPTPTNRSFKPSPTQNQFNTSNPTKSALNKGQPNKIKGLDELLG